MNEHRKINGIGMYGSYIILLFLIMGLTPSAAAADYMTSSNFTVNSTEVTNVLVVTAANTTIYTNATTSTAKTVVAAAPAPIQFSTELANPASVYCSQVGGTTSIKKDAAGNEYGMCTFPTGSSCEEWALFRGECKPQTIPTTLLTTIPTTVATIFPKTVLSRVPTTVIRTVPTIVPKTEMTTNIPPIYSTPSSLPSAAPENSKHGDFNASLLIIIVLVVLLIVGGGYVIYRLKKKPPGDQSPDNNEITVIVPRSTPTGSSSYSIEQNLHDIAEKVEPESRSPAIKQKIAPSIKNVIALTENGRKLLLEAEKLGKVPKRVYQKLDSQDIPTIENVINELEDFLKTARPLLEVSLGTTQFTAGKWYKTSVILSNPGNAHAFDVSFSFSEEFESKRIKSTQVEAGKTEIVEFGILPKKEGTIPFEITLDYRDAKGTTFKETHEFWIEVVEKGTATSSPSETPVSPVSQFTPRPLTPKQLPEDLSDKYTESEFIGKGGFARVFKAKRKDGKYVAIKIPIALDSATGKSFVAEIQNWTKLNHNNIVKIYDFNIMPLPYFEMELCDSSLAEMKKPIESEEAAWLIFNVCEGLKFTHAQKIIHRDLKPQNILMKDGTPKISDWGLSRVITESSASTATSFTPYYAAPEQINNRVKDERTDIWQLGVILYELVTGVLPFKGESMVEIGMNIATKDPKRPGEIISGASVIDAVVMKCLQKDPAKRYQSVLELQKDLAMYLRKNYAELLKESVTVQDSTKSAYYCGDLVIINMLTGDMATAYKYLLDLVQYSKGIVKVEAQELSDQLKMRMEMGVTEIPPELIQKADLIVHQVSTGFRNRG